MKRDESGTNSVTIGRPKTFDREQALNHAMLAFWEHGFETTSMSFLIKKMNMNAPSIYAEFGNKKKLFLQALDRYVGKISEIKKFVDESPTAFEAADQLLKLSATRFTGLDTPRGCMLASAAASGSRESADIQKVAAQFRAKIENVIRDRILLDIERGELPKATAAADLATLTIALIQGMSVLARDGASRNKLVRLAETAHAAWPKRASPNR